MTHGVRVWLVTAPVLLLCGAMASGCAHSMQTVTVTVRPESVSVTPRPVPFMGTGDQLRVVVYDSTFSNRYVAVDSTGTLIGMDRAPLFGDTALKAISLGFPVSRILSPETASPSSLLVTPSSIQPNGEFVLPESPVDLALGRLEAAGEDMDARANRVGERLDSVRNRVRADPAEQARLRLLADTTWLSSARIVSNATEPGTLQRLVDLLEATPLGERPAGCNRVRGHSAQQAPRGLPADTTCRNALEFLLDSLGRGPAKPTITPGDYFAARRAAVQYGRLVDALRVQVPLDELLGLTDSSSVPQLLGNIAADVGGYERSRVDLEDARADLNRMAPLTTDEAHRRDAVAPRLLPPRRILGMDLDSVVADTARLYGRIDTIRNVVSRVNRNTAVVAGAMTLLPRWTATTDSQTVVTRIYPSQSEVRVVVLRRDRFAPWTGLPAPPAPAKDTPAPTTQSSTANGTTITTVTTVSPATAGGGSKDGDSKAGGGSSASATLATLTGPAGSDTVAVLSIPVLQRYRFHLGVGMVYSFLHTDAFETRVDTMNGVPGTFVRQVGTDRNRLLPVAMLSYTVVPLKGRFIDGRAHRNPWNNPSVQLQGGFSLQDPTKQLFGGVSVEAFPGLEIGGGWHFAYVETSIHKNQFVADTAGPATNSRWRTGKAISLTFDATTFVRAFGGLFGL